MSCPNTFCNRRAVEPTRLVGEEAGLEPRVTIVHHAEGQRVRVHKAASVKLKVGTAAQLSSLAPVYYVEADEFDCTFGYTVHTF